MPLANQPRAMPWHSKLSGGWGEHAVFAYLRALSHKPNPIKVITSKTTSAAMVR